MKDKIVNREKPELTAQAAQRAQNKNKVFTFSESHIKRLHPRGGTDYQSLIGDFYRQQEKITLKEILLESAENKTPSNTPKDIKVELRPESFQERLIEDYFSSKEKGK